MMFRIVEVGTRSSSGPTVGRMVWIDFALDVDPEPLTGAFSTSTRTIRPPGPVPVSFERSMFFSSAIFLAKGDALTRTPLEAAEDRRTWEGA